MAYTGAFLKDIKTFWKLHQWTLVFLTAITILCAVCVIHAFASDKFNKYLALNKDGNSDSKFQQILNAVKHTSKKEPPKIKKYESKCREVLEQMFNAKFPCVRPHWLVNPKTNRRLELDCYNENMKLALEYQGGQHADFSYFYHRTPEVFEKQKWRDAYKRQQCKEKGIFLITVPHTVEFQELESYVRKQAMIYMIFKQAESQATLSL